MNPRTRDKILRQLAHFYDLDPRYAHRIPPNEQTVGEIYRLLKGKGAPHSCYIMGMSELDGREIALREGIEDVVGTSWGNFLSCIPGKLGLFVGEEPNERYVLER